MRAYIDTLSPLKVGDVAPAGHEHAGWIYGGISKTAGKPFYVAPKDAGVMRWQQAIDFAARSNACLPSHDELNQMYEARNEGALQGTFNTTGTTPAGSYWSSSRYAYDHAWTQRFSDGDRDTGNRDGQSSLRCVRR